MPSVPPVITATLPCNFVPVVIDVFFLTVNIVSCGLGLPELVGEHSSIDWDGGAGHVRGVGRSDEGDHVSDLLWGGQPFEGYGGDKGGFVFVCIGEAGQHAGVRGAGSDYVYANASPCDFQRCGFGHSFDGMFAGYINGCSGGADASIG